MAKTKQKQLLAIHARSKKASSSGLIDTSNTIVDEDDWIMVKKQRITIFIPSLSISQKSSTPKPGQSHKAVPSKTTESQPEPPNETCPRIPSADGRENSLTFAPKSRNQLARKKTLPVQHVSPSTKPLSQQHVSPSTKPLSQHVSLLTKPLSQHVSASTKAVSQDLGVQSGNPEQICTLKFCKGFRTSNTLKVIKRPRLLHGPSVLLDGDMLNQRLRALILERKLQKAGGLSKWLASLGLSQFVSIFERKNINKFQLVHLTMKKLKDMGATAVGPRRKLMHAIDCVCQPYCFSSV